MRRSRRALTTTLALTIVGAAGLPIGARPGSAAPILALRPGPIDRPLHLVGGDFDRDGKDDLLVANFQAGTLTLLVNQGDGTFALHADSPILVGTASFSFPTAGPLHMAVGDLNPEDADSDGALNAADNCPNVFNPPAASGAQGGDVNLNGVGDECETLDSMGNRIDTDGDGRFDYDPSVLPAADPVAAALDNCPRMPNPLQTDANMDHIGDDCAFSPDVVIAETNLGAGSPFGIVRVKVNTGAGGLESRPSKVTDVGPAEVLLRDFSGDGRLDLVVSNSGSDTLQLFVGETDGEFGDVPQFITTGDGPQGMAALDFDGDGLLDDLAVANRTAGTVGLYLNTGTGLPSTMAPNPPTTMARPTALLSGVLNNDACADLVVLDQDLLACAGGTCTCARGSIEIFSASPCPGGTLSLTSTITLSDGECPRGGTLADLDLDGDLDLAVADFTGGQVLVYEGDGNGTFSPAATLPGLPGAAAVASLDLDSQDATGPDPDLAVLGFEGNRVDLLLYAGPTMLSLSPTTPASPWTNTSALALFAADAAGGNDIVLLQGIYDSVTMQCSPSPPRIDVLTGIGNGFFRPLSPLSLEGPVCATSMVAADLFQDTLVDLLVVDRAGSTVSVVAAEPSGIFTERDTIQVGAGPAGAAVGSLITDPLDYDRDGVADLVDNCPTRYNPPFCRVTDPQCAVDILCVDATHPAPDCDASDPTTLDPVTMQCDSDRNDVNGVPDVGDHCQLLNELCLPLDTDSDLVFDYNPGTRTLDNCPWIFNSGQGDTDSDGIGDFCDSDLNDIVAVSPSDGTLTLLIGDGSGSFREAMASPVPGFSNPAAAVVGRFSLSCSSVLGAITCDDKATNDIAVVEQVAQGNFTDDQVTLLVGDGTGRFSRSICVGGTNHGALCTTEPPDCPGGSCRTFGPVPAQGDPTALLSASNQPVCANPANSTSDPGMRFDRDSLGTTIAVLEPNSSSVRIYLPSSAGLVPPPGNPLPLPLVSPPSDAAFVDLNQDDVMDLVILSSDGDPSTPSVTIYVGIANGLFYTDPSLNPAGVKDGAIRIAAGNVDLAVDVTYPDVVVFDAGDRAPIVLTNVLKERADIDGSGRVDGFDLAIFARTFGATRGENFIIEADGTLRQSGSGFTRVVEPSGVTEPEVGRDLPEFDFASVCDQTLDPLTGAYGLPVDLNLDGVVDGEDLALLASLFGRSL